MRLQRYVSNDLTHFVGRGTDNPNAQYDLLIKIIHGGWLTHPPHEETTKPLDENFDASKLMSADGLALRGIVCFCDILPQDYYIHMTKYSKFGISFLKSYLTIKGASPVYYVAKDSIVRSTTALIKVPTLERELNRAIEDQKLHRDLYFDTMSMSLVNLISALPIFWVTGGY